LINGRSFAATSSTLYVANEHGMEKSNPLAHFIERMMPPSMLTFLWARLLQDYF